LIVPEAEAKVHHVLLCEGASLPKRANIVPLAATQEVVVDLLCERRSGRDSGQS
jgi:hypothetical protein